jgi:hypothetical protein
MGYKNPPTFENYKTMDILPLWISPVALTRRLPWNLAIEETLNESAFHKNKLFQSLIRVEF